MSYMPRPTNMQSRVSSIRSDIRESGGIVQNLLDFTDGLSSSTLGSPLHAQTSLSRWQRFSVIR